MVSRRDIYFEAALKSTHISSIWKHIRDGPRTDDEPQVYGFGY